MTLVGSKLFVFGGQNAKGCLNGIWALDLNCCTFAPRFPEPFGPDFSTVKSNPFWESYEPAPGNEKPLPRAGHVSVATGDRIITFVSLLPSPSSRIIMFCRFGGFGGQHNFNDTWSFNILKRKWTELQCTGSIPSSRTEHAAVLVNGVMYVFGGLAPDETKLGSLTAFKLSSNLLQHVQLHAIVYIQYPAQRWTAFRNIRPRKFGHAIACDGTRVFVLGGLLTSGAEGDETKLIHVLDTSMYFLFVISFGQPPSLKTQSTSITRNPTLALSALVRRPPNSCRSRQRVPRPEDNHISRYLLRRMHKQHMVLLLFKKLPQKNWTAPPSSRLLASKTPI